MIRLLLALALGVTIGAAAVAALTADPVSGLVWPIALSVAGVCLVLLLVARSLRGIAPRALGPAEVAEREGRLALARIDAIRQTGRTINDHPLCELDLTVGGPGVEAYRTTIRELVPVILVPQRQPGTVLAVQRASREAATLGVLDEPPQPWFEQAVRETVLPQTAPRREIEAPRPLLRGPLVAVGAIVLLLVGAVGAVGARWPAVAPAVAAWESGGPLAVDLQEGAGLAEAVDLLVAEVGGTRFTSMVVGREHVSVTAPSAPGASTVDDFRYRAGSVERVGPAAAQPDDIRYRAGSVERVGPAAAQPDDIEAALFDVGLFDPASLPGLVAEARRLGGLEAAEAGITLQPAEETGLRVVVNARDDYHSVFVIFAPDGAVVNLWGGAPGSEAAEHDPAVGG